jgi:NTE family protein
MQWSGDPLLIDLALQGGGSHGAFTWGVLDRLLEEPWLHIAAISGTSAGAMNAAVLADGWTDGGAAGARAALDRYWERVSRAAAFSPLQRSPLDRLMGRWTFDTSPLYIAMDLMSRVLSPYDLNPLGLNPLRSILAESIDFERLVRSPIKLFVTATNVHTGRGRIFRNAEITADVLLASACLPGGGNRWRAVLGRRLRRQSDDHAAHSRKRRARYHPGSDQPA